LLIALHSSLGTIAIAALFE